MSLKVERFGGKVELRAWKVERFSANVENFIRKVEQGMSIRQDVVESRTV